MFDFTQNVASRLRRLVTPQRAHTTISNPASGYTRLIDDWFRLDCVLILGADGGAFYVREQPLTEQNARAVTACLAEDGERVVRRVVEISTSGRAQNIDAALFVLAIAASSDDDATRTAALDALPRVASIEA